MDMKALGKWSYLIGLVLVIVTAFVDLGEWVALTLVILAVLAGLFHATEGELTNYGVRYLTLVLVAATLGEFPFIGEYITAIASGMVGFFGPAILTMLLVFNFDQAMEWAKG